MDSSLTPIKLPIYEIPLFPSARNVRSRCKGCRVEGILYGGYYSNEFNGNAFYHKECAEAPGVIVHPSHRKHPLLLIDKLEDRTYKCDVCGEERVYPGYNCIKCKFKVDLTCGIKPPSQTIEHPVCHEHPLVFLKKRKKVRPCEVCKESIEGASYSCLECQVFFHVDCVHLSKEVNHFCHSQHPLKLMAVESLMEDAEKICLLCEKKPENVLYYCSVCNFSTCLVCIKNPTPNVVEHTKTHEHPLTLFSRRIFFPCNICGNLGPGHWECGVCRKSVNRYNGAYSCSACPNYAVHSGCAVRKHIWDGVELEGVADDVEVIAPFKVVGDGLISHFCHEKHALQLQQNDTNHDADTRCEACVHPVGFDPIYSCQDCRFVLHQSCANLPMKTRLVFDTRQYSLLGANEDVRKLSDCKFCGKYFTGFKYMGRGRKVDVHCGSISEPFVHEGHSHPLYFYNKEGQKCYGCHIKVDGYLLSCDSCNFGLCLSCANLPKRIMHRNDEHPLTLCCGETASGKYWCDICEKELDQEKWFYTCSDCGVTLHIECVLGDFSRLMPGCIINFNECEFEVVLNNQNTRPLCSMCLSRCKVSVILKDLEDNEYICSRLCFLNLFV
ncbi:PREDICTED: uncharacterized protein LOC104763338 [Camelina sativa]|uniref:Uncharacterized protein LOC104763338 n=1 Tax=Camelina sativa TaxID=90675 RepID=A0ABM1R9C2_CAMSA|nr:PREDICTED: uncharacterized protein LOC104763338 [Camelina sativa]